MNLTFKELKIYYSEKDYHLDDKTFEVNLNLRNQKGEYNLLADRNNIPLIFVKFLIKDKLAISERSDYGYRCIITSYDKIKNRLQSENICISVFASKYVFEVNDISPLFIKTSDVDRSRNTCILSRLARVTTFSSYPGESHFFLCILIHWCSFL